MKMLILFTSRSHKMGNLAIKNGASGGIRTHDLRLTELYTSMITCYFNYKSLINSFQEKAIS